MTRVFVSARCVSSHQDQLPLRGHERTELAHNHARHSTLSSHNPRSNRQSRKPRIIWKPRWVAVLSGRGSTCTSAPTRTGNGHCDQPFRCCHRAVRLVSMPARLAEPVSEARPPGSGGARFYCEASARLTPMLVPDPQPQPPGWPAAPVSAAPRPASRRPMCTRCARGHQKEKHRKRPDVEKPPISRGLPWWALLGLNQ